MKISVICPTYNSSLHIKRAMDSLLDQTEIPYEVIFSDDGSTDDTITIINNYKEKFSKKNIRTLLISNKHSGPGKNRNIAMSEAVGEWFAFLDSDDEWKIDKLERVKHYYQNNNQVNVFLNWEKFHMKNGKVILLKNGNIFKNSLNLTKQLYKENFLSTSAVIIHKSLYSKFGGFDESLPNAQDYDYWLKLSPDITLCVIKEYLGIYFETSGNITRRPYRKKIISLIRIAYRYKNQINLIRFIKKIFQILFSKNWIKDLIKLNF